MGVISAHPYITLAAAIIAVVSALNKLSTASIDASEKAKEAAQKAIEVTDNLDEEKSRVNELIEEYKELRETESADASSREQIRDIQKEINKLVGGETSRLDLVNGKLDDQLYKLKQIQLEEAKRNQSDYIASYSSAKKSSEKAYIREYGNTWAEWAANIAGTDMYINGWDENAAEILNSINGVEALWSTDYVDSFVALNFDAEGAQEYYDILTKCIEAMENDVTFYHQNNDVYNHLVLMRKEYEEFLNTVDEATTALAENAITIENLNLILSGKAVNSIESYEDYRNQLIDATMKNKDLAQAIADGEITRDSITLLVDDTMASNFSDIYSEWTAYKDNLEKITTIKTKFKDETDIDDKITKLSNEQLEIACKLIASDTDIKSFEDLKKKIEKKLEEPATKDSKYFNSLYKQYQDELKQTEKKNFGNVDIDKMLKSQFYWYASTDWDNDGLFDKLTETKSDVNSLFLYSKGTTTTEVPINYVYTPLYRGKNGKLYQMNEDTIREYIEELINKAGDNWTVEDILALDREGLEKYGVFLQNMLIDIGETSDETAKSLFNYASLYDNLATVRKKIYDELSKEYTSNLKDIWNSKDFEETKASLIAMAKTVDGITPDAIKKLAEESSDLAGYLAQDGMNAKFLANILQIEALGGDGFALITENALNLNTALEGMTRQFDEVTAAKSRYDAALSAGEKDDDFKSYAEAFEALNNEFKEGTVNSNAFWAAAEFIFGADQLQQWGWSDGIDEIYAAMQKSVGIFEDAESAGAGFLDQLYKFAEGGQVIGEDGSIIAEIERFADGSYEFNVDGFYLDELAEKMGLSKEAVIACIEALSMWGDVDYYDMDEVLTAIRDIGLSSDNFEGTAVNISALTDQLLTLGYTNKDIFELLNSLKEIDGIELINVDSDVTTLTESLQNLGIATSEAGEVKINADSLLSLMQSLQYTKEDAQDLINKLDEANGITLTNSAGEVKNVDDVLADIETRTFATVESELSTVSSEINDATDAADTLYSKLQMIDGTTVTVSIALDVKSSILKSLGLQGFAKGTKNAPDGVALVGEEGEELIKSGDMAYLAGTHGAEIVDLNPGDTVYTAAETKRIKRSAGGIHGAIPAYSGGYSGGSNGKINTGKTYKDLLPNSDSSKSSIESSSSTNDDKIETFDWIEIAIDRIEQAISKLKTTAESAFKSLSKRLSTTNNEISKVREEINLQSKAYERYLQEANSVGLPSDLVKKVQDGTIDINEYDSDTRQLIKDYQGWYEKALDCSDAISTLHETLASFYEDKFNNVKDDFENQLSLLEHLTNSYDNGINELEAHGYLASTKYYAALKDVEQQNIAILQKELADLTTAFSDAMASGEIEKYSDSWYDFQESINGVKEAIAEANVQLLEYSKTMREIEWEHFDFVQDRISQITQEADFLIDLMSNKNLYQDSGQLSDEGLATMGLHAQNYNVYMAQADQYADELLAINKELANDPNNTELIERREELLKLQQESILAAEDEKQAIIDMVEEGIKIELENLKELIDTYKDSLDSAKDLYEYQKKIEEKSKNIASLQKQLSAYENDTSEETRAKIQQIKVDLADAQEDLEETEYEQFISDTKELLDNLYTEYETILNERLDNVDALLADMIDMVNANAVTISGTLNGNTSSISDTLERVTGEVGYTMSEEMKGIWNTNGALGNIVTMYGGSFLDKLTTINAVLSSIQANTAAMIAVSNQIAQNTTQETTSTSPTSDVSPGSGTGSNPNTPSSPAPSSSSSPSSPKTISVGGKINAGSALIYDYAGDNSGENQYFANDPIYTVLKELNGYLQVRWHKLSSGVTGWFRKSDVKAYKTGGLVDYTGLAQLDGTPGKPEIVLNAKDTKNFLELRDVLRAMAQRQTSIYSQVPNTYSLDVMPRLREITDMSRIISNLQNNSVSQATEYNFGDMNINIDHVEDYNDLVTKMQRDKKFEKMICSMTTDRLSGGSSLAKNKYRWTTNK